jgi:2,3-bisphosphoglycerate-dependent phosphoglycerate mutase
MNATSTLPPTPALEIDPAEAHEVLPSVLVLIRHGQSEWNRLNLFTGWRDPDLTERGVIEARWAGRLLRTQDVRFDAAFTSGLKRAQNTLDIILAELDQADVPVTRDVALNERDYGDLSGLDKDEARRRWGDQQILIWRRSYDIPPPGGESLKDTAARVLPYYQAHIWPQVAAGRNVIVAAHGNSLRALIMHLERLTGEEILARELATAAPIVYRLKRDGIAAERRNLLHGSASPKVEEAR